MKKILIIILSTFILSCESDDERTIIVETSDLTITVDENPENGLMLGKVQGKTNYGNVSYSIKEQNPNNSIEINSTSGEIKVLTGENFDFEINQNITGVIKVSNEDVFDYSYVTININDIEEDVFYGNVTLTTQKEINEFGSNNYRKIVGDLIIEDNPSVHDIIFIDTLKSIEILTGKLIIQNMYNWLDIPEFSNLKSVGGLEILNNEGLLDVNSFSSLQECTGNIVIENNSSIDLFCGLYTLLTTGNFNGELIIKNNFKNPTRQEIIDGGNCGL